MLHHLSFQVSWEQVIVRVHDNQACVATVSFCGSSEAARALDPFGASNKGKLLDAYNKDDLHLSLH